MKYYIITAALTLAAAVLSSCDMEKEVINPDNPGTVVYHKTITVSGVDTGGIEVSTVKAQLTNTYNDEVFAEAAFTEDGFTIVLDNDFRASLMRTARDFFGEQMEISSPDARFSGIQFSAYHEGAHVGNFNCSKDGNPFFFSFSDETLAVSGGWSFGDSAWEYDIEQNAGFGSYQRVNTEDETTRFTSDTSEQGLVWTFNKPKEFIIRL